MKREKFWRCEGCKAKWKSSYNDYCPSCGSSLNGFQSEEVVEVDSLGLNAEKVEE